MTDIKEVAHRFSCFPHKRRRRISISTYSRQILAISAIIAVVLIAFPFIKLHYGNQLSFSRESGFYDSPFYLSIYGGGKYAIHYTLDGREPTVDDPVYDRKNPLYIEDATNHPNVYSVASPENLFDNDTGIYVTGNTFNIFLKKDIGRKDNWERDYW